MKLALFLSLGFALGHGFGVMIGHCTKKDAFWNWYCATSATFLYLFLLYLDLPFFSNQKDFLK